MVVDYKGRNDIGNWTCINYLQYVQSRWEIIYSMYRAGEVSVHRACCKRAAQPYSLGGEGVRFDQAQDQQVVTTRSPRIVTECLLTRSMLIKMYVHVYAIYSRFRIESMDVSLSLHYHYRIWWALSVLAVLLTLVDT